MKTISNSRRKFIKNIAAASAVAVVPQVVLQSCNADEAALKQYDLLVYGATPGGVACAVRSAREGLNVLLVSYNDRVGGMLTSGLGVWDTLYEGYRSPIYNELRQTFFDYYRNTYGEDSQEYTDALPGETGHNNGTFEAHVAERLVNELVNNEDKISVLLNHYPVNVNKQGKMIETVSLQKMDTENITGIRADYFTDCSYEGDLMAVAEVKYRVGRESKSEFNEKHAGEVYMKPQGEGVWNEKEERVFTSLNIRHFGHHQNILYPQSTHKGDNKVQAYNMRYYATSDPANQVEIKPSEKYDPEYLKTLEFGGPAPIKPNNKCGINRPQLVGFHNQYVEGDWPTRKKVIGEHIRLTRDMFYFIQNDPQAPAKLKDLWKGWGLAKDEYVDNDNNPYEIYVREARRLVGKHVYTENDLALHPNYDRTPIHPDSIGIIEWYQDCHACTFEKVPGSLHEGKMMIHKETFIGQFPYQSILPNEIDNLLVPVCVSGTHVAWGAIRLEPTWMQLGESAAYAILQSKKEGSKLSEIDVEGLVQTLANKRSMVTFFNDFYIDSHESWIPAIQYFGTKGFFTSYNAQPSERLDKSTAGIWVKAAKQLKSGKSNSDSVAKELVGAQGEGDTISTFDFNQILEKEGFQKIQSKELTRGEVCKHLYDQIK